MKTSTLSIYELYVIDDGFCCKLISIKMEFECQPSDIETVMHERYDAMTKVPNIRFEQIAQPCVALVEILMRFQKERG